VEVIVFGGFFLELVFGHVARLPGPGEEIFTDEFAFSCGGGVTVADAATRAGARTGLVVRVGTDLGSRVLERHCAARGIDLSAALRSSGATAGITVVVNFDADRAFLSHLPERRGDQRDEEAAHWLDVLRRTRPAWCTVHAGSNAVGLLAEARALGVGSVVDVALTAIEHDRDAVIDCVRLADVFVPNEAELRRLTGEPSTLEAAALAATWCKQVVVKRGAAGALLATPGRLEAIEAGLRPVPVHDRTGAGDAFAGAVLAALTRGASLPAAIAAGNAAGSEAVGRLGGVGPVALDGLGAAGPVANGDRTAKAADATDDGRTVR
jgi:sugar/nucleoside kinase (ribokinase family)